MVHTKKLVLLIGLFFLFLTPTHAEILSLEIVADQSDMQKVLESALTLPSFLTAEKEYNKRWLKYYQKQLPQLVADILQPLGYFKSQTQSQLRQSNSEQQVLHVSVVVGEALNISQIDVQILGPGTESQTLRTLQQTFPLKVDDVLRQDFYEQGKALLLEAAIEQGFLDAHFSVHQISVSLTEYRAEIALYLETGQLYLFGPTSFSADTGYSVAFLNRFLSYQEGDSFSHKWLGQTQLNLLDSDFFNSIDVTPMRDQTIDDRVPIRIDLDPAARHQWRPGLGYGTDTGFRVSLRNHDLNLFGTSHQLKGELLLAEYKQTLAASYIIPDADRLDSQTQIRAGLTREESDSYLSRELFNEVEYQRALSPRLVGSLFLRLTQELYEISSESTRSQLLLPGLRLQWSGARSQATRKINLSGSFEFKGAHDSLFSDTTLLQFSAQVSSRFQIMPTLFAKIRLQGGSTWLEDSLSDLPASLRFFAGGDRSVRGYGYQTLGPEDSDGDVVGGQHLLVGNFELEKHLTTKWGGAIFYDLGNAFDSFANYDLAQGAGVGVRRYTPIGSIGLDLARQVGVSNPSWRVHLSMGFEW
jgi:translocation and assembly module TamA